MLPGLAVLLGLNACTASYYATSCNPAPLLREANEVTASAGRSTYNYSRSNDLSVAYSPIDKLGLLANISWIQSSRGVIDREQYGMNAAFYEGAIGYYHSWDDNLSYDVYLGFGQTQNAQSYAFDFGYLQSNHLIQFDYSRVFLQPALAYTSEYIDVQVALRASQVTYGQVVLDSISRDNIFELPPESGARFILAEPGITLRGGYRYLKVLLHVGYSFNLSPEPLFRDFSNLSVGVAYNFKPSFKAKPGSQPALF